MPRRRLTPAPDRLKDYDPASLDRIRAWAAERWGALARDWWLREEWEKCRDWHRMNDVQRRDWEAAFRNWLRRATPPERAHRMQGPEGRRAPFRVIRGGR